MLDQNKAYLFEDSRLPVDNNNWTVDRKDTINKNRITDGTSLDDYKSLDTKKYQYLDNRKLSR